MRPRPERSEQTAKEYFLERAAADFDEMRDTAKNAPYGISLCWCSARFVDAWTFIMLWNI